MCRHVWHACKSGFHDRKEGEAHEGSSILLVWTACLLTPSPASANESPFLYGTHDHDTNPQPFLDRIAAGGATGWVTATVAIGSDPNNRGGDDFSSIANQGHTVIVRLNNGYCPDGTIPPPSKYADFARRAANYVAASRGANIWVIIEPDRRFRFPQA